MEPFHEPITVSSLIGLILATYALYVIIVMMGMDIYKEHSEK